MKKWYKLSVISAELLLVAGLFSAGGTYAAQPAADVGAPTIKQPSIPANGEMRAEIKLPSSQLPPKPWKIPPAPLRFSGQGVCLYYLIPDARVKHLLPPGLRPFPGQGNIWFRVDFIHWSYISLPRQVTSKKIKRFVELAYRLEVVKDNKRGTYLLTWYADAAWPVLWTRYNGDYPAFPIIHEAAINLSPYISYIQLLRGDFILALVEAKPRQGVGIQFQDLLSHKADLLLWQSGGQEFVSPPQKPSQVRCLQREMTAEISSGQLTMVFLRDPRDWKILSEEEILYPQKVLLLNELQGTWMGEMQKAP